ncbi:MAG: hypothetical protein JSU91_00305 [Thermoplasmatales archaeon]|nr:MAG: hypothetical protein JSU91_00305 [Thermoplasmatales archaeon]
MKQTKGPSLPSSDVIKASEIGQYCYCSIAWYLQKCGFKPKSQLLEKGVKKHEELGSIIEFTKKSDNKSKSFEIAGYLTLILGTLIFIFGVIL